MRLDKFLSDLGIASRKELKQIIKSGRVSVNGSSACTPDMQVNEISDMIMFDGIELRWARFRYFAMDKPKGVLTASTDKKQQTVLDIIPDEIKKIGLFPVGRLDKDTTGLLLLTNDGDYAHRVISPKHEIEKRYLALTEGNITDEDVIAFKNGIVLRDGLKCLPAKLEPLSENKCLVTVMEGKYHQVKRMLASVGKPVVELRRLSIGDLYLDALMLSEGIVELTPEQAASVLTAK